MRFYISERLKPVVPMLCGYKLEPGIYGAGDIPLDLIQNPDKNQTA